MERGQFTPHLYHADENLGPIDMEDTFNADPIETGEGEIQRTNEKSEYQTIELKDRISRLKSDLLSEQAQLLQS
jgi:hypothetical protein